MSKKKRKRQTSNPQHSPPEQTVAMIAGPADTQNEQFAAQLQQAQRANLETALWWGKRLLPLRGVEIGLSFGYDIQQFMNMLALQEMQPKGETDGETATSVTG